MELESEARREGKSVAELLHEISSKWLEERRKSRQMDAAEQDRIRKRVMSIAGSLSGGDPRRAARASERVREILKEKYASDRSR